MTDDTRVPPRADAARPLNAEQLARADAALDAWYTNLDGSDYRAPGVTWSSDEQHKMHAALEAPDVDSALRAFGATPCTWLTSPELDAENQVLMTQIRHQLGLDAPGPEHEDTAVMAESTARPPRAGVSAALADTLSTYDSARDVDRSGAEPDVGLQVTAWTENDDNRQYDAMAQSTCSEVSPGSQGVHGSESDRDACGPLRPWARFQRLRRSWLAELTASPETLSTRPAIQAHERRPQTVLVRAVNRRVNGFMR